MVRYQVLVCLDLHDDDQTDKETVRECVEKWVHDGIAEDYRLTDVHWPPCGPEPERDPHFNVTVEIPHGWKPRHVRKEGVDG